MTRASRSSSARASTRPGIGGAGGLPRRQVGRIVVLDLAREARGPAAWVLLATLPLVGLTVLAGAVGWGHPAYVETSVYVGLALLAAPAGAQRRAEEPALVPAA